MLKYFTLIFFIINTLGAEDLNLGILKQANRDFENAKIAALNNPETADDLYLKAINSYRFLLEEKGIKNSDLHNNLGNAYFFNGELGKAILQYHKALYLNPVNSDAQHNLKFAQQQTNDVVHENIRQQLIKLICFWHGWQPNVRLILFFIAHSLFWIACALRLYKSSLNISRLKVYSLVSSILLGVSIITTITGLERFTPVFRSLQESNFNEPFTPICLPLRT